MRSEDVLGRQKFKTPQKQVSSKGTKRRMAEIWDTATLSTESKEHQVM
jgi:hypothetical protein